jgi:hypothetical protein
MGAPLVCGAPPPALPGLLSLPAPFGQPQQQHHHHHHHQQQQQQPPPPQDDEQLVGSPGADLDALALALADADGDSLYAPSLRAGALLGAGAVASFLMPPTSGAPRMQPAEVGWPARGGAKRGREVRTVDDLFSYFTS